MCVCVWVWVWGGMPPSRRARVPVFVFLALCAGACARGQPNTGGFSQRPGEAAARETKESAGRVIAAAPRRLVFAHGRRDILNVWVEAVTERTVHC